MVNPTSITKFPLIKDSVVSREENIKKGYNSSYFIMQPKYIHPSAEVSSFAIIGKDTYIWHLAQVRERAKIGNNCIIGKDVYIDQQVVIGDNVKIQNGSSIYHGAKIEDGVFIGPGVILTNDKLPRAINPDGSRKTDADWKVGKIVVRKGASVGAGVILLPDIFIGRFAMVAAGSVVTKNVPNHGLVMGVPGKLVGFVCFCGKKLVKETKRKSRLTFTCHMCQSEVKIPLTDWKLQHDSHS